MLSLAKATKDYYLQKLGEITPREDYYLQGGTATGVWCGSGAVDVGLWGSVSAEGLVRMFDGEHPATGEQLGVRLRRNGVAAWDVTFSADKSVSLLWALGDESTRREVLEAFDTATSEAVAYLEVVASSTRGARRERTVDDDGVERVRVVTWPIETTGYVAASFTEFTSRAGDPQLHTHVVVANKVQGTDGKWRSLDGRRLYRHQLAAGYLHEAEVDPRKDGWARAHIQVTGDSTLLGHARGRLGLPHKRLGQFHIPVGGYAYRPCLEDFIEFAIQDGLLPGREGWEDALEPTRAQYHEKQLRSLVKKHPGVALDELKRHGHIR